MDFNNLINHSLENNRRKEWELELQKRVKELCVIKGTHLLNPGEICKYVYFVKSGFFRTYRSDNFIEETIDFAGPGHFALALKNFLAQEIGNEGIVCEANAIVLRMSYQDWISMESVFPQFLQLSKQVLQEYILFLNYQKNIYRTSNATQKYFYLCEQFKGISNIVKQKHIASYLGITGPTFSNLLKDQWKKPK